MRVSAARELSASPERVWATAVRWEEQPGWMRDAARVRVLGDRREGPGVRIRVLSRVFRIPLFTELLEVTAWEPPRRLEMAHRSAVRGSGAWTLEPSNGGTSFRWTEDLRLPVPVLGEVVLLVYRPFLRRLMRRSLEGLQRATSST